MCIERAFAIIEHFESRSGFRISYEKTTLFRIGSLRKSDAKLYTKNYVKCTSEPINILGVDISTNQSELCTINYNKVVEKIPAILNRWRKRNLILMGKVLIVNSLIMSLFVYKMSVLPKMPYSFIKKSEYLDRSLSVG